MAFDEKKSHFSFAARLPRKVKIKSFFFFVSLFLKLFQIFFLFFCFDFCRRGPRRLRHKRKEEKSISYEIFLERWSCWRKIAVRLFIFFIKFSLVTNKSGENLNHSNNFLRCKWEKLWKLAQLRVTTFCLMRGKFRWEKHFLALLWFSFCHFLVIFTPTQVITKIFLDETKI